MLKCEHTFCRECIDKLIYTPQKVLKQTEKCPECRGDFNTTNDVKTPFLFMRKQFSLIKLRCKFHANGCKKIIGYDKFVSHINQCWFDPDYEAKCEWCHEKYEWRKNGVHEHRNDCNTYLRDRVKELSSPIIKHRGYVMYLIYLCVYFCPIFKLKSSEITL